MTTFDWNHFETAADSSVTLNALDFSGEVAAHPATLAEPAGTVWSALSPLAPACVIPASVQPCRGTLLLVGEATGSQFDALSRLPGAVVDGLRAPVIANAAMGRSFHGNRGRPWHAARGNLHLSALFPCDLASARCGSLISAAACLAVCDAIREITRGEVRPEIKWVNDVRLGAAKVSGILTTARALEGRMRSVIFGIGLNVLTQPPAVEPTAFVPSITHLAAHHSGLALGQAWAALVDALTRRFDHLVAAPEQIVSDYRRQCGAVGREVRIYSEDVTNRMETLKVAAPLAKGRVARLDESLGVVLEGDGKVWTSGRLAYEDECLALGL